MKKFIRYFRIFNHSAILPVLTTIGFFVAFVILLFYSNAEISSYASGFHGPNGFNANPIRFHMGKMDPKDAQILVNIPNPHRFSWISFDEDHHISWCAGDAALTWEVVQKLEKNPGGVVVNTGYREATGKDRVEINGHVLPIVGEQSSGLAYQEGERLEVCLEPTTFAEVGLKDIQVEMYFQGLLSKQDMVGIVQGLEDQGLVFDDLQFRDFLSELDFSLKPTILLGAILVFSFITLNILAIFNYVLSTRQKGLSILRTFGLSQASGSRLIAMEMTLYSLTASLLVLGLFFLVLPKLSQFYQVRDLLLFLGMANVMIFIATAIMARIVLHVPVGTLVKENWNE